ncbi:Flp family type IVb pilin [Desulfobotulus sp.]|uniref:Flp family type IVb pilin n=1 Tax=Desulfobotulus sp. TaxID=1940337 RepID=UPI002A370388|nr:Flp family type IVb pilin [Desulfobotulus sp.]MDY0164708.1 Flp family type IVb pilin [Desulfobotulus sp.]
MKKLINLFKEEDGATAVEYGIMVALIAVAIIAAVSLLGKNLNDKFQEAANAIEGAGGTGGTGGTGS